MFSFVTLFFLLAAAGEPAKSNLVISPCHAGEHYQYEIVSCSFELKNIGDRPITVSNGQAKTLGDYIAPDTMTVAPHSSSYLNVKVQLGDSEGETQRTFVFESDEKGQERRGSTVFAFVSSVLDQSHPAIDFGNVESSGLPLSRTIVLSSREVENFRITRVESKPEYVNVAIGADGRTLKVSLRSDAPWGMRDRDGIVVNISSSRQPKARIAVKANIIGDVVADGSPYSLGLMRTNTTNRFLIRLSSRISKEFRIGAIKLTGVSGNTEVVPCVPVALGCKLVALTINADQPSGRIDGLMKISLPDYNRDLPVEIVGMLLPPDVEVHNLNAEMEKARENSGEAKSESLQKPAAIDLASAIRGAVEQPEPAPPGRGPLLRWSVAHEGSIYGYLIYRATSEDGPPQRINSDIIHKLGGDPNGAANSYQWRDNTANSGVAYWYSIGVVKRSGEKELLGESQKVVAK